MSRARVTYCTRINDASVKKLFTWSNFSSNLGTADGAISRMRIPDNIRLYFTLKFYFGDRLHVPPIWLLALGLPRVIDFFLHFRSVMFPPSGLIWLPDLIFFRDIFRVIYI
jgi:hypothetical protein